MNRQYRVGEYLEMIMMVNEALKAIAPDYAPKLGNVVEFSLSERRVVFEDLAFHEKGKAESPLLQVERVGINDDFFELGGHSLLLTQVGMTLRNRLGVTLPLHALFELSSIQALASHLQAQRDNAPSQEAELELMDELLGELENL